LSIGFQKRVWRFGRLLVLERTKRWCMSFGRKRVFADEFQSISEFSINECGRNRLGLLLEGKSGNAYVCQAALSEPELRASPQ